MSLLRSFHTIVFALLATFNVSYAAEETAYSWPLGPIGGKFRIWTAAPYVRVSQLTAGAPGAAAGLQVNDFILGAFGRGFDPVGSDFQGAVRQLGAAIEHAESNDGLLPLKVLRGGSGVITINVNLPALGALDPAFPLTSAKYAATYEYACSQLHSRVMADNDGDLGYPTGFIGLSLLGHPNWADTTGAKPYRLSINKIRDYFIARITAAVYAPVEDLLLDSATAPSANPNFVADPVGLESWSLGQAVMFLAEYQAKTGDNTRAAVLQRGAELMANRVQYWKQPTQHANGHSPTYEYVKGMTSHGGVTGDYMHLGWGGGINMTGLHLFAGLALAKRTGVDMTVRPKDGHYFGYTLRPGDPIPSAILSALPASIVLPRIGGAAPETVNDPFYYDLSLDQKFWMKWDFLVRSSGANGHVTYHPAAGGEYDAGGRTPAAMFGLMAYHGATPLSAADQTLIDAKKSYIIAAHERHLHAHAYSMGGGLFTAMVMPWFSDRDQRFFWDNWKFYANLMRQPDGTLRYFRGRNVGDPYQDESLVALVNNALPRSVAIGGLSHVPGYDTNRVFVRFKQPLLEWPTPAARKRRIYGNTESFIVDLVDATGATVPASQVTATWSVVSGPVTSGLFTSTNTLNTTASFPQPGTYRVKLDATANSLSASEQIDIVVMPSVSTDYVAGEADYKVYSNPSISGTTVASLIGAPAFPHSPNITSTLTSLEGTHSGSNFGATITTTIVAPETGTYRFYVSSDDGSSLRFNAGGVDPSGAVEIASVTDWTNQYQWNKYSSQQSNPITLTAGQQYYLQALHKEGSGSRHVAVAWTTPSNSTITVIGSPYIARSAPFVPPAILTQPTSVIANLGDNVNLSFTTAGSDIAFYQWRLNGVNFGTPQTSPTLTLSNIGSRLGGVWDCVLTSHNAVLTTDPATVTINGIGGLSVGGLWQEVFTNVSGSSVEGLLNHPSYPLMSSSSGPINESRTVTIGDNYGQRFSGWIIPSTTGRYRFYIAADDAVQLYLSPDPYESHKQLIHSSAGNTSDMAWSSRGASTWIQLTAGQRYYVELLHKESSGGDHASFTWQKEGDPVPTNGSGLIPSANLQYAYGGTFPDAATAPPYATADTITIAQGSSATLDVVTNDIDANPASLEVQSITQPANGTVTQNGRHLTYSPTSDFSGTDSFTYTLRNGLNLTSTATVTVTITSPWTDMIAWWKLDENTGTTAADATGNGHTATLTSGTTWTPGKLSSGIYISSSTQMASTAAGKPVPGAFSISAWMKPTNTSGVDTVFSFGSIAALRTNGSGLRFTTFGVKDHDTAGSMFTANTWTHIALTFTPNTTDGAKFYVNGVLRQSIDSSTINTTTTGIWRIGAAHLSSEWFGGALDDVRLYSRVLSDQDIATIAATTTPFEQWRIAHHNPTQLSNEQFSGPLADPDKDGIDHLTEYALGLRPLSSDNLNTKITHELTTIAGNKHLRLTILKNPAATDVTHSVEVSSDLVSWNTLETFIETNTPTTLIVRDTFPMSNSHRRFITLRVTKP